MAVLISRAMSIKTFFSLLELIVLTYCIYFPLVLLLKVWSIIYPDFWMNSSLEVLFEREIMLDLLLECGMDKDMEVDYRLERSALLISKLFLLDFRILTGV